jgi:UDP-N-acetylmuramoyl-L-alanyl-D-glutamate--2,6-diaminopimelate ligase
MPGRFNAENALVAAVICKSCNVSNIYIEKGLRATTVKGRTQVVREASHIATFIIDYAHNALSMESLLSMLKGYNPEKLICLFGGGGNKPKQRRYDMGAAAGKYADLTILTEDNPRYEEIENINNDIIVGLDAYNGKYEIILDRKEAIEHLIDTAKPGYIVALIGKGHETYQDVKGVKTYFCEEEIIREYVKNKS